MHGCESSRDVREDYAEGQKIRMVRWGGGGGRVEMGKKQRKVGKKQRKVGKKQRKVGKKQRKVEGRVILE